METLDYTVPKPLKCKIIVPTDTITLETYEYICYLNTGTRQLKVRLLGSEKCHRDIHCVCDDRANKQG